MATSTRSPPATTRYALVRAAGVTLAVPVDEVIQALPLDGSATRVPRSERALVDVVQHRGRVVPVVDLSCWGSLQREAETAASAQVLILQKDTRSTGIAIECTLGIVIIEHGAVHRVHHDNAPHELFDSVLTVDGCNQPVPLLNTDHLLRQTEVWVQSAQAASMALDASVLEAPLDSQETPLEATRSHTGHYVVVELDGLRFALPVEAVGTLMPTPAIQRLPGMAKGLQGVFAWDQRDVPVVRIHEQLGLAAPAPDSPLERWLLVVRGKAEALGILVSRFVAVQRFATSLLRPAHTPLGASVVPDPEAGEGCAIQLLSAAALFSALPMSAMGAEKDSEAQPPGDPASSAGSASDSEPGKRADASPEAHVIFQAGRTMATPLKSLQAIVINDRTRAGGSSPVATHYSWRGKLVPLIDLRLVMEGVACVAGADARVLIAQEADQTTAMLVESVIDLVPALAGTIVTLQMNHGRSIEVLTADTGGEPGSYEIVGLGRHVLRS